MFFGLIGFFGFFVSVIILIVCLIRKKPKNKALIALAVSFALFIFGVSANSSSISAEEHNKSLAEIITLQSDIDRLNSENTALKDKILTLETDYKKLQDESADFLKMSENEKASAIAKSENEKIAAEKELSEKKEADAKAAELQKEQARENDKIVLSSGNYIAGKDFPAGTYDIVAISGDGNVSSSNMYKGGLNAVMGTSNNGFSEKEYKNISLPQDTELNISGVKIALYKS